MVEQMKRYLSIMVVAVLVLCLPLTALAFPWSYLYTEPNYPDYVTPASENGLNGTMLYVEGRVQQEYVSDDSLVWDILDTRGNRWIAYAGGESAKGWKNKLVTVYGFYLGVSEVYDKTPTIFALRYSIVETNPLAAFYEPQSFEEIHASLQENNIIEETTDTVAEYAYDTHLYDTYFVPLVSGKRGYAYTRPHTLALAENFYIRDEYNPRESYVYIDESGLGDYVYICYDPADDYNVMIISYHMDSKAIDATWSNYSTGKIPEGVKFSTQLAGQVQKPISGVEEIRRFLFSD
jgi:hypothetical protein